MSLLKRVGELSCGFGAACLRQARRGKLNIDVRRLESRVSSEKDAIGHALFPLLEAGTLQGDVAGVHDRMKAITELLGEIRQKRAKIKALARSGGDEREGSTRNIDVQAAAGGSPEQAAENDWESEGGHTSAQDDQRS